MLKPPEPIGGEKARMGGGKKSENGKIADFNFFQVLPCRKRSAGSPGALWGSLERPSRRLEALMDRLRPGDAVLGVALGCLGPPGRLSEGPPKALNMR